MYRQLNSPKEIARRITFLVYVLTVFAFFISLVVSFARAGVRDLIMTAFLFGVLAAVRYAGYRRLDFGRLFESFPTGCARDAVPERIRTEVECLVDEFHAPYTDWTRRAAIRHRLIELEEEEPEIIEAYDAELKEVLAA